jgi:hypothetical protein
MYCFENNDSRHANKETPGNATLPNSAACFAVTFCEFSTNCHRQKESIEDAKQRYIYGKR